MSKPMIVASSAALVWGTAYALCGLIAMVSPTLYFGVLQNWLHGFNLELVKSTTPMTFIGLVSGVITFCLYIWVITFAMAWIYTQMAKRK